MNAQLQVARLEALLATIRTNAADLVRTRRGPGRSTIPPALVSAPSPSVKPDPDIPAILSAPPPKPISALPPSAVDISDDDLMLQGGDEIEVSDEFVDADDEQNFGTLPPSAPPSVQIPRTSDSTALGGLQPPEEVTGERPAVAFGMGLSPRSEPVRTPPPESGPQVALSQEFEPPQVAIQQPNMPTLEQLGSTVELGDAPPIEIQVEAIPRIPTLPPQFDEDLEASLPSRRFVGAYDSSLTSPPSARAELEAHDRAEKARGDRRSSLPAAPADMMQRPPSAAPVAAPAQPQVASTTWERPSVPVAYQAAVFNETKPAHEVTFMELLDSALSVYSGE